jgi:hypothetical protein
VSGVGGVPGCGCRSCRPGELEDDEERAAVATVRRSGWEVVLVGADGDAAPAFAYTVGLPHRVGHPELLISGLRTEVMQHVLNEIADGLVGGLTVQPGDGLEGLLVGVPLLVEQVSDAALERTVTWSSWFHRRRSSALQLVWPDAGGRFAWQPGANPFLHGAQPPSWRVPSARTGGFATDPDWPFPVPADQRVFACRHVLDDGAAVCFAAREAGVSEDEDWTFHCGAEHGEDASQVALVHAAHIVRSAPSLRQVAGLAREHVAWREHAAAPWQVDRLAAAGD